MDMTKIALLTVHGMGRTTPNYAESMWEDIAHRLGPSIGNVGLHPVYYQGLLQPGEDIIWKAMQRQSRLRYSGLREFLLFGFGDAAGIENEKEEPNSSYKAVQLEIAKAFLAARNAAGGRDIPLVCISHSLGCHVLSSYLYDAQHQPAPGMASTSPGIWADIDAYAGRIAGRPLTPEEKRFLAGGTMRRWLTTGCNIPIFVAAHAKTGIVPIAPPPGPGDFHWLNLYDPDDVLGWPLGPLCPAYKALVEDREINAGTGLIDWLLKSWNPLSHTAYWSDSEVLDALQEMIQALLV
jgi:hypothetical protein